MQSSMNSGSSSSVTKPQAYPHSKLHHEINSMGSTPPQQTMSDNSSGIYILKFIKIYNIPIIIICNIV